MSRWEGLRDIWLVELDKVLDHQPEYRLACIMTERKFRVQQFWRNPSAYFRSAMWEGEIEPMPKGTVLAYRVRFIEKVR